MFYFLTWSFKCLTATSSDEFEQLQSSGQKYMNGISHLCIIYTKRDHGSNVFLGTCDVS